MALSTISLNNVHPFPLFLLQFLTSSILLGFTSPASLLRLGSLPLIASYTYLIAVNSPIYMRQPWTMLVAGYSAGFFAHYISMIIKKWSFESQGPSSPSSSWNENDKKKSSQNGKNGTMWERLCFGWSSLCSFRDVDTPHEVKNVPHFSESDPNYIPTRTNFLVSSALRVIICYIIMDVVESNPPPPNAAEIFDIKTTPVLTRLGEISVEEVIMKIITSGVFWVLVYCLLVGQNSLLSFIWVGLGGGEVRAWRPWMGSFGEAYTIRGFWGKFWHQATRKFNTAFSDLIADSILHLRPGTLLARYSKIFLVFFFSGALHLVSDVAGGIPLAQAGSLKFFCIQALGVMLEDGVQAMYRKITGKDRNSGKTPVWAKIVGFVWMVAFLLFWTTPTWSYPSMSVSPEHALERKMLPFSLVGLLKTYSR